MSLPVFVVFKIKREENAPIGDKKQKVEIRKIHHCARC